MPMSSTNACSAGLLGAPSAFLPKKCNEQVYGDSESTFLRWVRVPVMESYHTESTAFSRAAKLGKVIAARSVQTDNLFIIINVIMCLIVNSVQSYDIFCY